MPDLTNPRVLSAERYTSQSFAEQEWERVWVTSWLILGRADEIPEAGDFLVEEIGPESIIMVRQTDGAIKCFYNLCQHRGNRLLTVSEGGVPAFTCGYHGWRYALDGECIQAQDAEDFAVNPCKSVRLSDIRCEEFGGFVWINLDGKAQPLQAFLGPVVAGWNHYPCGQYTRLSGTSVRLDCNWKTAMDNFHEAYHVAAAHSVGLNYMEDHYQTQTTELYPNGHALNIHQGSVRAQRMPASAPMGFQIEAELQQWGLDPADFAADHYATRAALQRAKREQYRDKGFMHYTNMTDRQLTDPHHFTVFPNLAVTFNPDGMLFLRALPHPTDPQKCLLDTWFYTVDTNSFWAKMLTSGSACSAAYGHVPRRIINYGEESLGPVLDDDAWVLVAQQQGFRSRAYQGSILAGQESRITQYHGEIDRLMAAGD
jgi:phenylpropionate dioxygenase-like ring-hydroxylating dioxygenase large terminal subunit